MCTTFSGLEQPTSGALKCATVFTASALALNMLYSVFPSLKGKLHLLRSSVTWWHKGQVWSVHRFQKSNRALLFRKESQLTKSIRPSSFHGKCIPRFALFKNKGQDSWKLKIQETSIYTENPLFQVAALWPQLSHCLFWATNGTFFMFVHVGNSSKVYSSLLLFAILSANI